MTSDELLASTLSSHDLKMPDGRMLCKYRCDDELHEQLRQSLKKKISFNYGSFAGLGSTGSAAFCLYASEWWRKNYSFGPWRWHGILESLDLNPYLSRADLYDPIQAGLKFWKRELLTVGDHNAYLVTLACEGGLPLNLIQSDNDSAIRRYLRALLREFRVYGGRNTSPFDLASRIGYVLPISLRQKPLFQLCGELIEQVLLLQKQLSDIDDPVTELDSRFPGWRDNFPLVVSDDAATALLNNLVKEAVKISRVQEVKVSAILKKTLGGYALERKIHLPSYFDAPSLSALLNLPVQDLPYRIQLHQPGTEASRLIALISRRTSGDEGRFAVESPASELLLFKDVYATKPVWLQASSGENLFDLRSLKGGLALSELPWVFVQRGEDTDGWELLGEGSLKTKFDNIIVAVKPDVEICPDGGECQPIGEISSLDRCLYQVKGTVYFRDGNSVSVVEASSTEDDSSQYLLYGDWLSSGSVCLNVYKGLPRLQRCYEDGRIMNIPPDQIEWRPRGSSNGQWRPMSETCSGPITVRYAPDRQVRFVSSLDIVPRESTFRFIPGNNINCGAIEVKGFGASDYGLSFLSNIEVNKSIDAQTCRFELSCSDLPPATVELHLLWTDRREISFPLPYPTKGVRFFARDGRVLLTDEKVHVSQLSGVVVQVMEPERPGVKYILEASVVSRTVDYPLRSEGPTLLLVAPGRHELDLRMLEEKCRLLFSATKDLDAWIRIGVISSNGASFSQKIYIARYDVTLEPCRESGQVVIPSSERNSHQEALLDLQVTTFPLADPEVEMLPLVADSDGSWAFSPENRSSGPWLITGWSGDWCRTRPLCWTVNNSGDETVSASDDLSLKEIIGLPKQNERNNALDRMLTALVDAPGHEDWDKVRAYFQHVRSLPPSAFDVLVRLTKNHSAAATVLMSVGDELFEEVWSGLEGLPFSWRHVSVETWLKVAKNRFEYLSEVYAPVAKVLKKDVTEIIREQFESFFNLVQIRMPGIQSINELISNIFFDTPLNETQYLNMVTTEQQRGVLNAMCVFGSRQDLMQVHAEELWPSCPELEEDWWRQHCDSVPEELTRLWSSIQAEGYRSSVFNAPVASAFSVAFNLQVPKYFVFHLRRMREFDRNWFDSVYGCVLASCIGYRIENGMSFDNE